jgi:hypothetical protein
MKRLIFEALSPRADTAANRTDVACFIGFCGLRAGATPADLSRWLQQEGWWGTPASAAAQAGVASLYDLPLPLHSWDQFEQLFAWDQRVYNTPATVGATYLGAAVRSFFAQGGRKCVVISLGEPIAFDADRATRDASLAQLVPESIGQRARRRDWHGLHHLFGLPEVTFVALPDLAELASVYRAEPFTPVTVPPPEPQFVDCSEPVAPAQVDNNVIHLAAPRCTGAGYAVWATTLRRAVSWISMLRRDVQLLAALPLAQSQSDAARDPLAFMHQQGWLTGSLQTGNSLATAFLQLGYPWLQMAYSGDLPGNLEPPEGVTAGLLARNALTRGTFRSCTALTPQEVLDVSPRLSQAQQFGVDSAQSPPLASPHSPLADRVSLLGPGIEGFRLLSDVTTSNDVNYRQAGINRTIALVMRAARAIGEEYVFEASGERLWQQVQDRLGDVLGAMLRAGALGGQRPEDAFQVRCDRSTMTQQDIDSGRVIVTVMILPAASIETLRVQLTLGDGGRVSLTALGMAAA